MIPTICMGCGKIVMTGWCCALHGYVVRDPSPAEAEAIAESLGEEFAARYGFAAGDPAAHHVCSGNLILPARTAHGVPAGLHLRPVDRSNLTVCKVCLHSTACFDDLPYLVDPAWFQRFVLTGCMTRSEREEHPFAYCARAFCVPHECPPIGDGPRDHARERRERDCGEGQGRT